MFSNIYFALYLYCRSWSNVTKLGYSLTYRFAAGIIKNRILVFMNGIGSDRMRLEHSSWLQVQRYFTQHDLVLLPIGSTENHGSHMALGTDLLVPDYIAGELDKQLEILITPVMPFGAADHHSSFPGTLSIGVDGLYLVLSKICEDLWRYGARRFVFLNGHGGNNPALSKVGLELNQKGGISAQLNWWTVAGELNPAWKGGHAAGEETAAMMAILAPLGRPPSGRALLPAVFSSMLLTPIFLRFSPPAASGKKRRTSDWYTVLLYTYR